MHDSTDSISVEFVLSWEDWLDSRHLRESAKILKQYQADYLLFNAEPRSFSANEQGWTYTSSSGKTLCDWGDLIGVIYGDRVITLIAPNAHCHLPRSAFGPIQLASLTRWIRLALDES